MKISMLFALCFFIALPTIAVSEEIADTQYQSVRNSIFQLAESDKSYERCNYRCEKEKNECINYCGEGPSKNNPDWQECRSRCRETASACRASC